MHGRRELGCDGFRVFDVARDHEARVVSGQGADDLHMLDAVEGARDRRRGAQFGLNHDDVLRLHCAEAELRQHGPKRLARVAPAPPLRQHVAGPPERVARLLEPKLPNVSRDRRLGDLAPGTLQRSLQLVLAADPSPTHDAGDQTLPIGLWELPNLLHPARLTFQVSAIRRRGKHTKMLRKLLYSGVYAGLAAGSALVARSAASRIWRLATGEAPPVKR